MSGCKLAGCKLSGCKLTDCGLFSDRVSDVLATFGASPSTWTTPRFANNPSAEPSTFNPLNTRKVTQPVSVNLIAFPIRLIKQERNLLSSVFTYWGILGAISK
ncbi:MAG: hypothetical protein AB1589_21985 [Cyanobacteriota bacterium]